MENKGGAVLGVILGIMLVIVGVMLSFGGINGLVN